MKVLKRIRSYKMGKEGYFNSSSQNDYDKTFGRWTKKNKDK